MPNKVDKSKKGVYIWYSGATDVTGKKLAEALHATHGDKEPNDPSIGLVIGWGTKVSKPVSLDKHIVLNHPNSIALNRNKFESLRVMKEHGVSVAPFVDKENVIKEAEAKSCEINLPLIGRTKFHQGGKGFWNCPTITHVKAAIEEGANYFQNMIEIKDEYRLHTFGSKVIYAVKKVKRSTEEMEDAYIKHEMERQISLSEKNGDELDKKTMEIFLRRQAKKFAQDGANMLIRSNRLGWKFVKVKSVSKDIEAEAIKALDAIGLTFGAVDCCVDVKGKAYIIEVNSGPGLEETTFDLWVKEFKDKIDSELQTSKSSVSVGNLFKQKDNKISSTKEALATKVELMKQMVDAADENEASVLDKVFSKMFG